ncbi:MAG: hypothetical protein N2322_01300, partial [Terrimicrobiaceae bacterium]|nr:hypothetical protein [Terrimicrobiaceae bacterium]
SASLLQQPAIATYLVERLDALPEATRSHPAVSAARGALAASATLAAANPLPEDAVQGLAAAMDEALGKLQPEASKK